MTMRHLQINPQERAISNDINRAQKFKERDVMELLRQWLCPRTTWEEDAGVAEAPASVGAPPFAEVINGLVVRPLNGTFSLAVDGGIVIMVDVPLADGSAAHYMRDDGVPLTAPLTVGPNAGPGSRVDLVECALAAADETVSDSRDVFDPTTNLFTAASLPKEVQRRLQYRVRAGTPGSGVPALQAGWLPLAAVLTPVGALSLNDCTLWDVRPLLSDRVNQGPLAVSEVQGDNLWLDLTGPLTAVKGHAKVAHNGRWLGGELKRGSPGADGANGVDFSDATNGSTTFPAMWTIYLVTPGGLPRWVRYTLSTDPGTRRPRGCRGIPIISDIQPDADGKPLTAIALPVTFGGMASTREARSLVHGYGTSAAGAQQGFVHARGRKMTLNYFVTSYPAGVVVDPVPAPTNLTMNFTCTVGTVFPRTAKRVTAEMSAGFVVAAAGIHAYNPDVSMVVNGATYRLNEDGFSGAYAPTTIGFSSTAKIKVSFPVVANIEKPGAVPASQMITWATNYTRAGGTDPTYTPGSAFLFVREWEV